VPVGTVMSSLCRAREKMRERITVYAQQAGWQHLTLKGRP
jgi:DNA-directed RNA polymerase specialized sigma24 family protein